jgi:hypothetical protein
MSPPQQRERPRHRCHRHPAGASWRGAPADGGAAGRPGRGAAVAGRRPTIRADGTRAAGQELRCLSGACGPGRRRGASGQRTACARRRSGPSQRRPSSGTLSWPARPQPSPARRHQAPTGAEQPARDARRRTRPAHWSGPGRPGGGYSGYSEDTPADNVSSPKPRTRRVYSEDTQKRAGDNGGSAYVRPHSACHSASHPRSASPRSRPSIHRRLDWSAADPWADSRDSCRGSIHRRRGHIMMLGLARDMRHVSAYVALLVRLAHGRQGVGGRRSGRGGGTARTWTFPRL